MKILKSKIKPSESTLKRTLESGNFLFLLDGYDEVFSSNKQQINQQIELFMDSYSKNNFLITTRPGSGIESFSRFYDFKVNSLNNNQVKGFINKIVESSERSKRIIDIISKPNNQNYIEYLRNPLLLSMFIIAFESHPEIPTKKSSFYRNVYDTLYSKHDGITKNSYLREKLTKLEREEFEKILCIFSYLSSVEGKYSFTNEYLSDNLLKSLQATTYNCKVEDLIYDLRTTISILILDGFEYYFPHRSMQEYFTAQFIANIPSEKKETAYNNIAKNLISSSNDKSFNLWSMFNELDSSAFKTIFLIPNLKKFEQILTVNSNQKLFDAYFEMTNADFAYVSFNKKGKELLISNDYNLFTALIRFCDIYHIHYHEMFMFIENKNLKPLILKKISPNNDNEFFTKIKNSTGIKRIMIENGICDIIKQIRETIREKIKFLENEVEHDKNNLDNLLGML